MGKLLLEITVTVALLLKVVCLSGGELLSPLYPYGPDAGDYTSSDGDDDVEAVFEGTFRYFGMTYEHVYFHTNGQVSFGTDMDMEFDEEDFPDDIPFLTAFYDDVELINVDGAFHYRNSTADDMEDTEDIALAQADLELLGSTSQVQYVIVGTWYGVQEWGAYNGDPRNYFQLVLIVADDGTMYTVFNYERINWADVGVIGFYQGIPGQSLVSPQTYAPGFANAHICSNVGVPGRVVTQVDHSIEAPQLQCYACCTSTTDGDIIMYNGVPRNVPFHPRGIKAKITRTISDTSDTDPCRFLVRGMYTQMRQLNWLAINVGVHPNPSKDRHMRSYLFNRPEGNVVERGYGVTGAQEVDLPYEWDSGDDLLGKITISGDSNRWTLTSTGECGYAFHYGPTGPEPVFQALIPQDIRTDGPCGQA